VRHGSRAGFTLLEVIVAVVILSMGVLALVGAGRIASVSVRRATLELRAAELIEEDVERLRTVAIDSLRDGSAVRPAGDVVWTVTDSGSYLRAELVVNTRPEAGLALSDTVYVYRPR
jgi:prepilin-type N-terminal cleavage/methylation domain-containing protein